MIQIRDGDSTVRSTIGTQSVSNLTGTLTEYTYTNLNNTWAMTSNDKVALSYTGGDPSNYVLVSASATAIGNSAVRYLRWNINNEDWPFGNGYTWVTDTGSDLIGKFEKGGTTSPEKPNYFSLDGAIRGVGEKLINTGSVLNGDKITLVAPKLRAVGNPVGHKH